MSEGLEPEARADHRPAQPEPARGNARIRGRGRAAAGIGVAWMLILGLVIGFGELVTRYGNGNVLGDHTVPHWFATHRTPTWNQWSLVFSTLGGTLVILVGFLATCVVFLAVTRRWRPVLFVATVMAGELAAFLTAAAVVKRPGQTSRTSTIACRPRPTRPGTWPPPAASMPRWPFWSSATPAAGGGGCL